MAIRGIVTLRAITGREIARVGEEQACAAAYQIVREESEGLKAATVSNINSPEWYRRDARRAELRDFGQRLRLAFDEGTRAELGFFENASRKGTSKGLDTLMLGSAAKAGPVRVTTIFDRMVLACTNPELLRLTQQGATNILKAASAKPSGPTAIIGMLNVNSSLLAIMVCPNALMVGLR